MKLNPFFSPAPEGRAAARKADRAVGVLFVFLLLLLSLAKAVTFGF